MRTFSEIFEARMLAARQLLDLDRQCTGYVSEEEARDYAIEDLMDPHGKRFLFDDPSKVGNRSTSSPQALLGSSLTPPGANVDLSAFRTHCAFVPACERACHTCARICARGSAPASREAGA